jgi:outer membrane protein assembly factor BamB
MFLFAVLLPALAGADWPTFLHDAGRSGVTSERIGLPLREAWVFRAPHEPRPAWPEPAQHDYYHRIFGLRSAVTFDHAYHVSIARGCLYFGSSADDSVYAIDCATGSRRWTFCAGGPVRLAPSVAGGKVYFGSDDGSVYCLDAADGALAWKYRPPIEDRRIPGNGRIISIAPIRTDILLDENVAYFGAGLFPSEGVVVGALEAETGKPRWLTTTAEVSPQGFLAASPSRLFVPMGRGAAAMYDRKAGSFLGTLGDTGGAYAVVIDPLVASGPREREGDALAIADTAVKESVASFPGTRIVIAGDLAYLQSSREIAALRRTPYVEAARLRNTSQSRREKAAKEIKEAAARRDDETAAKLRDEIKKLDAVIEKAAAAREASFLWKRPFDCPHALILAGSTLFAGGEGSVAAIDAADGTPRWTAPVPGRARGLAVAEGRLFVSTDRGAIHCFASGGAEGAAAARALPEQTNTRDAANDDPLSKLCADAAEYVLRATGITTGYCVVLGCGEGRLAAELARRSALVIVGVEQDAEKAARARKALADAGLYGVRVAVDTWQGERLPYTSCLANLVVSEETLVTGRMPADAREVFRILRPCGGTAYLGQSPRAIERSAQPLAVDAARQWLGRAGITAGAVSAENGVWTVIRRGPLPGSGEWSQLYATPNHTASSGDTLRGPMAVQWFGAPGPRPMIDRHHRTTASLAKDGRLFIPGDDRVMAVDAYNGTLLWECAVPDSRRVGVLKSAGTMLLEGELLYIVRRDECWAIDVASGERRFTLKAPHAADERAAWGYLNCAGDRLFGTLERENASFTELKPETCDLLEGDFRPVIIGTALFSIDRMTGAPRWLYRNGAVMNSAIAVDAGRVFCLVSRNDDAVRDADGRLRIDVFCGRDAFLVALDAATGAVRWERPCQFPFQHILFLNGARGRLLVSGSYNTLNTVNYALFAFDMETGTDAWKARYRATDVRNTGFADIEGSHGEQWQHPVIIGDTVYSRPYAFDLATGAKKDYLVYRGGHGCGGLTGSAYYLFGRGDNPRMYPLETTETNGIRLTQVSRPGCWLNIIPACGMVLIPESSAGCTCPYPIQTSLGLIPAAVLAGVAPPPR